MCAAGQVLISAEPALAAFDPNWWEWSSLKERPGPMAGTGVDAVIHARRRS